MVLIDLLGGMYQSRLGRIEKMEKKSGNGGMEKYETGRGVREWKMQMATSLDKSLVLITKGEPTAYPITQRFPY